MLVITLRSSAATSSASWLKDPADKRWDSQAFAPSYQHHLLLNFAG